jgi:hypothetical protein
MNISRIQQMASQGDMSVDALRYLLDCHGECEHLDFKADFELETDYGCASFSKDAVGMKNVGGGYIIIGVEDKTWKKRGVTKRLSYDTKILRDKIRKATGLEIESDIVQHEIFLDGSLALFALILIRATAKRSKLKMPSIIKRDFNNQENWGLRQGDIYVRSGDSTKRIDSDEELRTLLDNLDLKYQEQEVEQANSVPSPFAVESGLFRLLPREYVRFVGRDKFKIDLKKAIEGDPRIWIINLYGPGGVGKSALATWVAYEYFQENAPFEALLHLSAKDLELSTGEGIKHLKPTLFSLEDFLDRVLHLFKHDEYCQADIEERKKVVIDILSAFKTLLVLDNMETITDGRIMEFVLGLPPASKTKVLITSRRRTSNWEYPIQVTELDEDEVREFVKTKSQEMNLNAQIDNPNVIQKIKTMSGGLPLAIQWILGEFAKTGDLDKILSRSLSPDSPLLEFSFRNSWNALDRNSQEALAVLSIFDNSPTVQEWRTALDWPVEKLEKAISSLIEVTFITERTENKTGKKVYSALPITLSFARNELAKLSGVETQARLRLQNYRNRMDLASVETGRYDDWFDKFEAKTDMQKKAVILCRMADGQARSLDYQSANQYYKQALDAEPHSVFALVSYGLFKADVGNHGEAIELIEQATKYCSKKTGYYVYFSLSKVYDQIHDRPNRIKNLKKALEYEPKHTIARHSLGVALSQSSNFQDALQIFDEIIREELAKKDGPSESLVYAYKTKIITLRRAKREQDANYVLQEAKQVLEKHNELKHLIRRLDDLLDE